MNSELTTWLEYSKLQLASEAFLDRYLSGAMPYTQALIFGNDHSSKFTPTEAKTFSDRYEVVAHQPNTGTGFSGTLFWDKLEHKYTLSFRSTEFVEDVLADSVGTNEGIAEYGWAFGQIADMEDWWADLNQSVPGLAGQPVTVTGYSLGGHLATAFAQLRAEAGELSRIQHIYTFNGAGTGGIQPGHTLTEVMALFRSVRDTGMLPAWLNNPTTVTKLMQTAQDRLDDILEEKADITGFVSGVNDGSQPLQPHEGDFGSLGLHFAMAVAGQWTTGAVQFTNLPMTWDTLQAVFEPNEAATGGMMFHGLMTELLGSGISAVATGGLRHTYCRTQIKIEDQPMVRGTPYRGTPINGVRLSDEYALNDFGDTHSLVLIIDSLAVMDTLARLDQNPARIDNAFATRLINAAGWHARNTDVGDQGNAEGDSLEILVDALHLLFKGTDPELRKNPAILEGGRWADEPLRNAFYAALEDITTSTLYQQSIGKLHLVSLAGMNAQSVATLAAQDSADGLAYRYALEQLNPFVLTGDAGLYAAHNTDGHLDADQFSNLYLQDRAAMLSWVMQFNTQDIAPAATPTGDTFFKLGSFGDRYYFEDVATHTQIRLGETVDLLQPPTDFRHIAFGSTQGETLTGSAKPDRLYGNAGNDTLIGGKGSDHLEGGAGSDTYQFAPGDGYDTVLDSDGLGVIKFGSVEAKGSAGLNPNKWTQLGANAWADTLNGITYTRNVVDGESQLLIHRGDNNVLVQGWSEGGLGIVLGSDAPPAATRTYTGSAATDLMMNWDLSGWGWDGSRDYAIPGSVTRYLGLGGADFIQTDLIDDLIESGDGNDYVLAQYGGSDQLHGGTGNDYLHIGDPDPANDGGASSASRIPADNRAYVDGGDGDDTLTVARHYLPMALALDGANANAAFVLSDVVKSFATSWSSAYTGWSRAGNNFMALPGVPAYTFADYLRDGVAMVRDEQGALNLYALFQFPQGVLDSALLQDRFSTTRFAPLIAYFPGQDNDDTTGHSLFGGAGNDMLEGGAGGDFIDGEADNDALDGERGDDFLFGGGGEDLILGGEGNDWMNGGGEADTLIGEAGDDTLYGDAGNDKMYGDSACAATYLNGDDTLDGGTGDDEIYGGGGNDVLIGGAGVDYLTGGAGDDTYVFSLGDGALSNGLADGITDTSGANTIEFGSGIMAADVTAQWAGGADLVLKYGASDYVFVTGGLTGAIANVTYQDGSVESMSTLLGRSLLASPMQQGTSGSDLLYAGESGTAMVWTGIQRGDIYGLEGDDTMLGGAGDDNFRGGGGNDLLAGAAGKDVLWGDGGNDTYLFGRGDGSDSIIETPNASGNSQDVLRLGAGILPEHVTLHRISNSSLLVAIDESSTQIVISYYFSAQDRQIERIEFDNGSGPVWTATEIHANVLSGTQNSMTGTSGNDEFIVDHELDTITEADNSGTDTVLASRSYTLPNYIENLTLTGYLNINGTGNALNNLLRGNSGDNVLTGNGGNDIAYGGLGNDTYIGTTPVEQENEGIDTWVSRFGGTLPDNVENFSMDDGPYVTLSYYGVAQAIGNVLDNVITTPGEGFYGEIIDGRGGADTVIVQGWDKPIIYIDNPGDKIIGAAQEIRSYIDYTLPAYTENLTLYGIQAVTGIGNDANNILDGSKNTVYNVLVGGLGNDTYIVNDGDVVVELDGEGIDSVEIVNSLAKTFQMIDYANIEAFTLRSGAKNSDIVGTNQDDRLTGNRFDNRLDGKGGNDYLSGDAGNDVLDGGLGADKMEGGEGDDTYFVDDIGDLVYESANHNVNWYTWYLGGVDIVNSTISWTLGVNIENLVLSGTAAINGTGNELDNRLVGNVANNVLTGGAGNDTLLGGAGDDTLDGGGGSDAMQGDQGNDLYIVDTSGMSLWERANEGIDTVRSSVNFTLPTDFENLILTGTASISGAGNGGDNTITGNNANNTLSGGAGNDTLLGGAGNDWLEGGAGADVIDGGAGSDDYASYSGSDQAVNVNLTLGQASGGHALGDTLIGIERLQGSNFDDVLVGSSANNSLNGGSGNDTLDGGVGNDWMEGGAGADVINGGAGSDDYASYSGSDQAVNVNLSLGQASGGHAQGDTLIGVESLRGSNFNDVLVGDAANNSINGGADNDVIEGGAGNDWLEGDAGADSVNGGDGAGDWVTYGGSDQAVNINLALNQISGGHAQGDTLIGVEGLWGSNHDDVLIGDAANNRFQGYGGNDFIDGGAGIDAVDFYSAPSGTTVDLAAGTATGGYAGMDTLINIENISGSNIGNDFLYGDAGVNSISGNGGNDRLFGWGGNDWMDGGAGNDWMDGGAGNDTLSGGAGNDTLLSQAGNDTYLFSRGDGTDTWTDSDPTAGNLDIARFGSDIAHDQIWFRRVGYDLETSVIGTTDKAVVKYWYVSSANHIERFESGNGKILLDSQVDALVSAMAAFSPPPPGPTSLPPAIQQALAPVLAANWQ